MKPNVFTFNPNSKEDFFSGSLAYILNLFPHIGQRFVQRLSVLAGKSPEYFGEFKDCEFVGYEYQNGYKHSKPDLKIVCSNGIIYFENKLESPLSLSQMQRHSEMIKKCPKAKLVFVSNIQLKNTKLRSLPRYLHPEKADHYCWSDFLPVFKNNLHGKSMASKILGDYETSLKENGMIGRTLKGATGSLYTYQSDASHLALGQLWDVMNEIGFKVVRKHGNETTLRAYPVKIVQYPLLNPRFYPTANWIDPSFDKECLIFTVLSMEKNVRLDKQLRNFHSTKQCKFIPDPHKSEDGYYYHGHFVLPTPFKGKRTNFEIDFETLKKPLSKILVFLK